MIFRRSTPYVPATVTDRHALMLDAISRARGRDEAWRDKRLHEVYDDLRRYASEAASAAIREGAK